MALRFDTGTVSKPTKTPQGFLRADATPTRCGVFTYRLGDGTVRRELRHPDEVFKADSLATLDNAPLTDEHPSGAVTADNAKGLTVGHTCERARQDGEHVRTSVLVTDAATIGKVEGKGSKPKRELSCGYNCDLDFEPGEYNGEQYDAVQKNIVYNHVALVTKGRAGPSATIRLDAADGVIVEDSDEDPQPTAAPRRAKEKTVKITIDGVEYDTNTEAFAQAYAKQDASMREQISKLQARADSAEADYKKAQEAAQVASDPKRIDEAVNERLALVKSAEKAGVKCDGLSADEIKKAVVAKLQPTLKLDGKDAAYIATAFDIAISAPAAQDKPAAPAPRVVVVNQDQNQDGEPDAEAARQKAIEASKNRWKGGK